MSDLINRVRNAQIRSGEDAVISSMQERGRAAPRHDDGSPAPEDDIAKAKRIMAAVDTYHERPDAMNRHALRVVILNELEAARQRPAS